MKIHLTLNEPTSKCLIDLAIAERRALFLQAEVLIMQALGTWEPDQQTSGIQAKSKYPKLKQKGGTIENA